MRGATDAITPRPSAARKVVIAHDFLETYGGAERVTAEMARAFPEARVHAVLGRPSVARRMGIDERFSSVLKPRSAVLRGYRLAAPILPALVDSVRLPEADVLLTSSYAFAHRFRTVNNAPQVCYCHSPLRFAWSMTTAYEHQLARSRFARLAFQGFASRMRASDRSASRRVTRYLTGSEHVAEQILEFYGRPAEVVGAPVDTTLFRPVEGHAASGDAFLFCGRLVEPYKQVGTTIEAFRRLPERLMIAGDGPAMPALRAQAPANVEFLGALDDAALVDAMQQCRAVIFPSRDDLGLIPLEAMACGAPVIAFAGGGALHTMIPGVTGELFEEQTASAIAEAVRSFDPDRYDPGTLRRHAERWGSAAFRERLVRAVDEVLGP